MMNNKPYQLLPFNFKWFDQNNVLLVNVAGDYQFLSLEQYTDLIEYKLLPNTDLYMRLESSQFLSAKDLDLSIELMATKYRTRKGFLRNFTGLHMMVITLRCNHKCEYCQVASETEDSYQYDMSQDTARRVVDFIFQSPGENIKIEFQGGEPVLNWKVIVASVEHAEKLNETYRKILSFVVCTNLTVINEDQLRFLRDHNISISTSLDGCRETHDANRKLRLGGSSYDLFVEKLNLARNICGEQSVSAIMATTSCNLWSLDNVVDEYIKLGFPGVFFRALNPYGFAAVNASRLGYPINDFITAFKHGLDYIIKLNLSGYSFREYYTTLLLTRIFTSYPTGFVDLQSPAGTGICGVIYDHNGDVYPADEARMLARMGEPYFLMGNIYKNSYVDVFCGKALSNIVNYSCVETMPGCAFCAYQAYCGADPVRNFLECGDIVGHRPTSSFCKKHMGIFDILFNKIRCASEDELDVLWSWVTDRSFEDVRI